MPSAYRAKVRPPTPSQVDGADFTVDGRFFDALASEAVHGSFERRSAERQLTGEWFVFEKRREANHYLTLARHREGENRKEGDRRVFERVQRYRALDAQAKGGRISGFKVTSGPHPGG